MTCFSECAERWKKRSSFHKIKQYGLEYSDYETIKTALRLADRLQSGEVSGEMIVKGLDKYHQHDLFYADAVFKAMAAQMISEVTDQDYLKNEGGDDD